VIAGFVGGTAPSAVNAVPHFEQNLAPARLVAPQDGQQMGRAAPHASQNLLSSGISEWQLGHSMSVLLPDEPWGYCSRVRVARQVELQERNGRRSFLSRRKRAR
jgi:hypothetical protein